MNIIKVIPIVICG